MYYTIQQIINDITVQSISQNRVNELELLIDYIKQKKDKGEAINLNFICTHNSRRSQFSQLWAKVAATYYNIEINSFSGGVEVTAFNERAIASIKQFGFKVTNNEDNDNPIYSIKWDDTTTPLLMFSKLYNDESNATENFATIMTCAHADENCPLIQGAEARIPIRYNDPKKYDNTTLEAEMYATRSLENATEMFYVFSNIG